MHEKVLQEIGLTKSEAAVYLALITLKSSTTGPITKEARISSGKIYEILDRLIEKGLITYTIRSGRKYFQPNHPQRIIDYIDLKRDELDAVRGEAQTAVKSFEAALEEDSTAPRAEIFEGVSGFKTYCEFSLNKARKGSMFYVLGVSKKLNDLYGPLMIEWQERRVRRKVLLKILYNHNSKEYGKLREKMKLTSVRYLPPNLETPASIEIFDDYVATLLIDPKPFIVMIRNKAIARSYITYFEQLWKIAKP